MFEDLKPAGLEAPKCAAANRCNARELKSGAVIRKFGSAGSPAQAASYTVQKRRHALAKSRNEMARL